MSIHIFRDDALADKSILVTGGGGGLGKEIGKALAAKVHICGRRPQTLEQAVEEISESAARRASHHACDVRDADQVEAMMDRIWGEAPLTGLLNNAAANSQSAGISRCHVDGDGRQLSSDARRGKTLGVRPCGPEGARNDSAGVH